MLRSRLALIVAFIFFTLCGVLSYAGPNGSIVIYRLLTDGAILIAWMIAAAGIGSLLLRGVAPADESGSLFRLVSAIAFGLAAISLLTLGLGLAGVLHRTTATAIIGAGVVLATIHIVRTKTILSEFKAWLQEPAGWNWLWVILCPFAAIALIAAMLPSGILWRGGDPSFYDVVEYHLQVPREWFEAGRIVPLPHNVFSFFPFNVEMHYLLAMHLNGGPWAAMFLAQLMHMGFIGLFAVAVYAIALKFQEPTPSPGTPGEGWGEGDFEHQGHATRTKTTLTPTLSRSTGRGGEKANSQHLAALVGALAVATVPWLTQLAPVAYDEGGFLLFGTLAIGWLWRAIADDQHRSRRLIVAGAFAGFACGAKLTAVPEVLLLGTLACAIFLLRQSRQAWWRAIRGALLFAAVGLLTFSPWLARNAKWADNPVFPEAARVFGPGNFTPVQVERWERAHSPRPDQRSASARLHAGLTEVVASYQYGYVLIPLASLGAALAWRRKVVLFLAAILLALAFFWLSFTHLEGRFFVLVIPICGLLTAQLARPSLTLTALVIVLCSAAVSGLRLHHDISAILHGGPDSSLGQPTVGFLGVEDMSGLEADYLNGLSSAQDVVLVGDAKAFFYTIPMSQLHYRTVFDVRKDDGDLLEDWNDGPIPHDARVIVDPAELTRFHNTYWMIPPIPSLQNAAPKNGHGQPLPFILKRENR